MAAERTAAVPAHAGLGLGLALASAATFGSSGAFAKALLDPGLEPRRRRHRSHGRRRRSCSSPWSSWSCAGAGA